MDCRWEDTARSIAHPRETGHSRRRSGLAILLGHDRSTDDSVDLQLHVRTEESLRRKEASAVHGSALLEGVHQQLVGNGRQRIQRAHNDRKRPGRADRQSSAANRLHSLHILGLPDQCSRQRRLQADL